MRNMLRKIIPWKTLIRVRKLKINLIDSEKVVLVPLTVANEGKILVAGTSSICDNIYPRLTTSVKRSFTFSSNPIAKQRRQLKLFGGKHSTDLMEDQKKKYHLNLLKWIVKDFQPVSIVENSGFLQYGRTLNPLYEVSTGTTN